MARRGLWALLLLAVVAGCAARRPPELRSGAGLVVVPNPGPAAPFSPTTVMRVPAWFIDPQATAVPSASDNNDCQTAATPCLTWGELLRRWGTYSPQFRQNTTVTLLSTQPDGSDPIVLYPILNGPTASNTGVTFRVTATLQAQTSGTLAGTVAKVRTTNTPLQVNYGNSVDTFPALMVNTTSNPNSFAWNTGASSTPGPVTQPMQVTFSPTTTNNPAEDNGWANGNNFTQYSPMIQANIVDIRPVPTLCIQTELCHVVLDSLMIDMPGNPSTSNIGDDRVYVNQYVWGVNLLIERDWTVQYVGRGSGAVKAGCTNCLFLGGFNGGSSMPAGRNAIAPTSYILAGGGISATTFGGTIQTCVFDGVMLDDDFLLDSNACRFTGYNYVGALQMGNNRQVFLGYGVLDVKTFKVYGSAANIIWGQGILDAGMGVVLYPSGAGNAANTFPSTSVTLRVNNATTTCIGIPANASLGACNTALSAANLDTNLGATIGCLYIPGGGAFCNEAL